MILPKLFILGAVVAAIAAQDLAAQNLPSHAQHARGHHGIGPNGGRIEESGGYHVELVAKDKHLDVYLTDEAQKAISSAGYKATAIFVVGGKPARILLEPAEANRLSGNAEAVVEADAKGAVRLTRPDGKTASVSFH